MVFSKRSLPDLDVRGKRVLVRCDFNVPIDANGVITDDMRIRASLPTLRYVLEHGGSVVACSHLGRPKGKADAAHSLAPVAARLSALLGLPVACATDVVGPSAQRICGALEPGQCALLENVRFEVGEEKNDPDFARRLASLADLYVNDAFGTAHRAHASTCGVAAFLPSAWGFLLEHEVCTISSAMTAPERPLVAILGGAKIGDKLALITRFLDMCDAVLIGGGMSFTFDKALGGKIGHSICDDSKLSLVLELIEKAKRNKVRLVLPVDVVAGRTLDEQTETVTVDAGQIPDGFAGFDIGPKTVELFKSVIVDAGTVVWNGPVGVYEIDRFAAGTRETARAVASCPGMTIVGGGDSAAAVEHLGYAEKVRHISTGGGAMIEFLEGIEPPGVACLDERQEPG